MKAISLALHALALSILAIKNSSACIDNLSLTQTDKSTITSSWNREKTPSCQTDYLVMIHEGNGTHVQNIRTSETSIEISNLEACETYNITVVPLVPDITRQWPTATKLIKMRYVKPSQIRSIKLEAIGETDSIGIILNEPSTGSKCIEKYEVKVTPNTEAQVKQNSRNSFLITSVTACTDYSVTLISTDTLGQKVKETKTVRSAARVFSKPKKPTFHDIKKNTSRFIVQFDRVKNLCEVQDVQVACNLNQDGETNAEVPKPKSDRITGILDHLRSSTEYECIVGILNDAGWSEWSEAGEFMTK